MKTQNIKIYIIYFTRLEKRNHLIKFKHEMVNNIKIFVEAEAGRGSTGLNWLKDKTQWQHFSTQ
jgi:hypothetical protein